jgi:predicted dehydrogenase
MNGKVTRRTFVKATAQAAGIATATGIGLKHMLAAGVHVAGNETIKVALVGCGGRGTGAAAQALRTKGPIKLWAMADLFAGRLESSFANLTKGEQAGGDREAHGGFQSQIDVPPERRFVGFDAYQKAIDSGVDLVILATHSHFRPMHFEYAVKHGKHLFMEKPLAVDAPGIRRILATNKEAKQKNLKVGVGLMNRHNLRFQDTVKHVQEGAVGPISLIRCYWCVGGLHDTPPRPSEMTEMEYQLRNPLHFCWMGGDHIVDAMVHNIDLACWMKGAHPISALGQGGRIITPALSKTQSGNTFDHHFIEYTFADESSMFVQVRAVPGCWSGGGVYARGPLGLASTEAGNIKGSKPWQFSGGGGMPYQVEHDVLIEAIRSNQPHNEVDYAAMSNMTGIMGRMASYSGQLVDWETAFNSTLRLGPEKYAFDAPAPVVADANGNYQVPIPGITKAF